MLRPPSRHSASSEHPIWSLAAATSFKPLESELTAAGGFRNLVRGRTNPSEPSKAKCFDMSALTPNWHKANPGRLSFPFSMDYSRKSPVFRKKYDGSVPVTDNRPLPLETGPREETNPSEPNGVKPSAIRGVDTFFQKRSQEAIHLRRNNLRPKKGQLLRNVGSPVNTGPCSMKFPG